MSHRSTLSRLAIASLAAAVLAAAPASAMPTDPTGPAADAPRQQNLYGSTVQPADEAPKLDLRGEAAADGGTGAGKSAGPALEPGLQGPPTWPVNPAPLPQPEQQLVATDSGDDIGLDLAVALLILAGTLALGGGMAVAAMKVRAHTRAVH